MTLSIGKVLKIEKWAIYSDQKCHPDEKKNRGCGFNQNHAVNFQYLEERAEVSEPYGYASAKTLDMTAFFLKNRKKVG